MRKLFRHAWRWARSTYLAIAAAMLATLASLIPYPHSLTPALNIGLAVLAVLALVRYFIFKKEYNLKSTELGKPQPASVGIQEIARAEDYIDEHYDIAAIQYFIRMLTRLPDHLSRVDEVLKLDGRTGTLRTRLSFRGVSAPLVSRTTPTSPGGVRRISRKILDAIRATSTELPDIAQEPQDQVLLVPLIRARKGILFDQFASYDAGGHSLPTLSQWETRGLMAVVLRTLVEEAIIENRGLNPGSDILTMPDRFRLLQIVKNTVCAITERGSNQHLRDNAVNLINMFAAGRISSRWRQAIAQLCDSMIETYLIVVEVPRQSGDNFLLEYKYVMAPERRQLKRPVERLRAKHGLLPNVADAAMTWPLQADSYHFELVAPPGLYVFNHYLEELETNTVLRQGDFKPNDVQQYVRVYHQEGRSSAHLYIRREAAEEPTLTPVGPSANSNPKDFKSIVEFREVPPGGLGNAATIALLTALMITFFAIFRVGIDPKLDLATGNRNQDIPALILTLPAFLAAAVGRGMTLDHLSRTSLTAFYGLWVVVATSVAGVLLYIYSGNRTLPSDITWHAFGHEPSFNLIWLSLAVFSVGVFLYLRKCKSLERKYYLGLLDQVALDRQDFGAHSEGGK